MSEDPNDMDFEDEETPAEPEASVAPTVKKTAKATVKAARPDEPEPVPEPIDEDPGEEDTIEITGELDEDEKTKLRLKAAANIRKQLRNEAAREYLAAEEDRLRALHGIGKRQVGGVLDEQVTFMVYLDWDGSTHIQLDMPHGEKFHHGMRYTRPRHIYNELCYIMQAQSQQQDQFDGKNVFERRMRRAMLGTRDSSVRYEVLEGADVFRTVN